MKDQFCMDWKTLLKKEIEKAFNVVMLDIDRYE
jgi:hypothetical protein